MSELAVISQGRVLVGEIRRAQVMDIVRAAAFIGALLVAWISLRPFVDLREQELKDSAATGNETMTYLVFGGLTVLTILLAMRDSLRGLGTLDAPGSLLFAGWTAAAGVLLSSDPSTSLKRFALTACVTSVAAMLMLLPKSQSELARWLGAAALILLAACYLGIVFAPNLSMHTAFDTQEPHLAGDWRGVFGHKNVAAAVMAMLLFMGIYVTRAGARLLGGAVIVLASLFLLKCAGKTSSGLILVVLALTSLTAVIRSFWLRTVILLAPLVILTLLSIGTVMSDELAEISKLLPLDTSFTGRTDIWAFSIQALQAKLLTGYGFAAFWGSGAIRDLPQGMEWTEYASHSHNGYLDTALSMGLPGTLLLIAVFVIAPLRDFHRAERGGNGGPLTMALLRIWLFGIYLSSLESFFLDRADPIWFTFLFAVFGLHYLARFRLKA
jgi:O-antigen ligase